MDSGRYQRGFDPFPSRTIELGYGHLSGKEKTSLQERSKNPILNFFGEKVAAAMDIKLDLIESRIRNLEQRKEGKEQ